MTFNFSPYHDQITEVLRRYLNDPTASFSIGSFGAIAEFHRDTDEPLEMNDIHRRLIIAPARGALEVQPSKNMRPLAYETLSKRKNSWQQGIAFCLPQSEALSCRRTVLTELGPDNAAIRLQDREAVLFDMGLGAINCDFCIRTRDNDLIKALRSAEGRSVLDPHNPVMGAIVEGNPHRIGISRLGRLEVFQAIGREKTPSGPHTHVLPEFLKTGRTHSANTPVPPGYLPCLNLYPASPLFDGMGNEKAFDCTAFKAFEELLSFWGPLEYNFEKNRALRALMDGERPESYKPPESRLGRTSLRIALRQATRNQTAYPDVERWQQLFDVSSSDESD